LAEELHISKQRKGRNLSQGDIKIRILSYLYNKGGDGANAYSIQSHCVPTSQEANRFKHFLDDLCDLERIEKKDRSDLRKGLITYNITQKGRETVQILRNPLIKDILGLNEDESDELSNP
jgi:hypothetical protein